MTTTATDAQELAPTRELSLLFTSDTHGCLTPTNYATGTAGAACVADFSEELERMRATGPTLFLDGGDSLQGTPLLRFWLAGGDDDAEGHRANPTAGDALASAEADAPSQRPAPIPAFNPVAAAFGAMRLDAFTLGNHDFNYGRELLADHLRAMSDAGAVCVCANVRDARGELALQPHVVFERDGLRIGVTGVVTDYVTVWEAPEHLTNLTIRNAVEAAREQASILRETCDVTICLYHGGFEEDLASGRLLSSTTENQACAIARTCDFDVLLTGHQHKPVAEARLGDTLAAQPPANAFGAVRVDVSAEGRDGCGGRADERPTVRAASRLVAPCADDRSPEGNRALAALAPLDAACAAWLNASVGTLSHAYPAQGKLDAALHGDALADLINEAQLEASSALISCTSLGNDPIGLPAEVTRRDICAAYRFMNTLMVVEVTPGQLKQALERCATYLELDESGAVRVSSAFLEPKVEHYNYDFYRGISYTVDLTRPIGERVVHMELADGTPLPARIALALNDYRASGTGGYEVFTGCKLLSTLPDSVPVLLERYIAAHPSCDVHPRGGVTWSR